MSDSRTVVLACDAQREDPLVRSYLSEHRANCAWRSLSLMHGLLGLLGSSLAGMLSHWWLIDAQTLPAELPRFIGLFLAEPALVLLGMGLFVLGAGLVNTLWPAHRGIGGGLEFLAGSLLALLVYLLLYDYLIAASLLTGLICIAYLLVGAARIAAVVVGRAEPIDPDTSSPRGLPLYTVLVPLYHEAHIAPHIVANLRQLDYPSDRLDVKILLEADDLPTRTAFEQLDLPQWMELVIVPEAQPKTKPRACNHGLARAHGEFLVIYDAEDRPEPDQLRKAVHAFHDLPESVACVQAHLAYHNHDQNLLTQLFAQEYNAWFRHYLPGLSYFGAPIPLGGTSNHFRIEALRACGGWDPFNVTEDCDLGMRLVAAGYRSAVLASTTWEEANSRIGNWIRQRSRWIKGYMQTVIVWSRRPVRLWWQFGLRRAFWFFVCVGSVAVFTVANPLLWAILWFYGLCIAHDLALGYAPWTIISERDLIGDRWSWPMVYAGTGEDLIWSSLSVLFTVASLLLLVFNVVFAWLHVSCGRRPNQRFSELTTLFALPLYWSLMSLAAWKALYQLIVKPHYWEKTVHGLD